MAAWWHRFVQVRGAPSPVRRVPLPVSPAIAAAVAAAVPRLDLDDPLDELSAPPLLPWLLALESVVERTVPSPQERRALRIVDALIQRPEAPLELIPRARTVIPHLLAMLRRPDCALPALAEQVGRDLVLTAEVMRAARSAALGAAGGPPPDLQQALARLGVAGLNAAIARVVLRPMFESDGDGLFARSGPRLWEHAEAKAQHCRALASAGGLDAFDAYLAGLMHNSGWTVALRALDRSGLFDEPPPAVSPRLSAAFSRALQPRCDALFGRVAASWQITPSLTAVAASAAAPGGLAASDLPLAALLRRADALASRMVAGSPAVGSA